MKKDKVELEDLLKSVGMTYEEAEFAYSKKHGIFEMFPLYAPSFGWRIHSSDLYNMGRYLVNKYSPLKELESWMK